MTCAPSFRPLAILALAASLLALSACASEEDAAAPEPAAETVDCPDLTGTWTSAPYESLRVHADHGEERETGWSSVFDVREQAGCQFSGQHAWEKEGEEGGEAYFAGTLDPETGAFAIIEPGSAARHTGRLDGDEMELMLRMVEDDRAAMIVYGTRMARGEEAPAPVDCPELPTDWQSGPYDVLTVEVGGEAQVTGGYLTSLAIESQSGCAFRARDVWQDESGEETGAAPVAGVIHADGRTLSLVEIPEPGSNSPVALLEGRVAGDELQLTFLGRMGDDAAGIAFALSYGNGDEPPPPPDCADVTGTWSGGPFVAHRISTEGETSQVRRTARELDVQEQSGCLIHGQNRWAGEDEVMNSEAFAGVVDPVTGAFMALELDPHPADGTSALITSRPREDGAVLSEYTGQPGDGSFAQVFAERLTR